METKRLYVDGEWVDTGDWFTVVTPVPGTLLHRCRPRDAI